MSQTNFSKDYHFTIKNFYSFVSVQRTVFSNWEESQITLYVETNVCAYFTYSSTLNTINILANSTAFSASTPPPPPPKKKKSWNVNVYDVLA